MSKTCHFDKRILVNHHEILHSKQRTPKFFRNPPIYLGQKSNDNERNSHVLAQWKKVKKFAELFLAYFAQNQTSMENQ